MFRPHRCLICVFICVFSIPGFGFEPFFLSKSPLLKAGGSWEFCLQDLSAEEQATMFERTLNFGASYSHGCTNCDIQPAFRQAKIESGDLGWVRRHYLIQFLNQYPWKNPEMFNHEFISIAEHDPVSNMAQIFPKSTLKQTPYRGRWIYRSHNDRLELMPVEVENRIKSDPAFVDAGFIIDGPPLRKNHKDPKVGKGQSFGHIMQTYPGDLRQQGARSQTIFDLAVDGQRMHDFFRYFGDKPTYRKLMRGQWRNQALRDKLKDHVLQAMFASEAGVAFGMDALFWDTVPLIFEYIRQNHPKSVVTRLLTGRILARFIDLRAYSNGKRNRIREDFFEVLARFSTEQGPRPVLLASLMDNPGQYIRQQNLEAEYSQLVVTFIESVTGIDLTERMIAWFEQADRHRHLTDFTDPLTGLQWSRQELEGFSQTFGQVKQRFQKRFQQHLQTISSGEHRFGEHRFGEHRSGKQAAGRQDIAGIDAHTALMVQQVAAGELSLLQARQVWRKDWVKPWLTRLLLDALQDLDLFLLGADHAFNQMNRHIEQFTSRKDHNVFLIDAKPFFQNFHRLVHPKTMHPTVRGAEEMAKMLAQALCPTRTFTGGSLSR